MGTTLDNGTYLPDEGERNCYEGLAGNWVALDNHLGSTNIHVTINDKQAWNGHVADTTIHVTSADKQAWNGHVADSVKHVTAEDKNKWDAVTSKADDSDVVHKSGNEIKSGELTLSSTLKSSDIVPLANLTYSLGTPDYKYYNVYAYMYNSIGRYFGNESNSNQRTNITLYANRDTQNQSCAYITRFRQNRSQGALQPTDLQKIGFDVLENEVRTNNVFDIQCTDWLNNVPQKVNLVSSVPSYSYGRSSNKALINDLNPGALSLPDLSNGIDISSYITIGNTDNNYTPPANGWIWIRLVGNSACIIQGDFGINSNYVTNNLTNEKWVESCLLVTKDVQATIRCRGITGIIGAKFYPCRGNI